MYESHSRHREKEVRGVLEKIQPDLITMDTQFLGKLAQGTKKGLFEEKETPFYKKTRLERLEITGKAAQVAGVEEAEERSDDDGEGEVGQASGLGDKLEREKLKQRMRGKNKSLKRYLRKKRKNVIDPQLVSRSYIHFASSVHVY